MFEAFGTKFFFLGGGFLCMDVFLHFSSSFAFENAFVYKITLSSIMRRGLGGVLGGVFTLSKKLFNFSYFWGTLAYAQYRVIELFPIEVVGLVFFTIPLITLFVFWADWRNRVIELPGWRCRVGGLFHL